MATKRVLLLALFLLAFGGLLLHYRVHPFMVQDKMNPALFVFSRTNLLAFLFPLTDVLAVTVLFAFRRTAVYGFLTQRAHRDLWDYLYDALQHCATERPTPAGAGRDSQIHASGHCYPVGGFLPGKGAIRPPPPRVMSGSPFAPTVVVCGAATFRRTTRYACTSRHLAASVSIKIRPGHRHFRRICYIRQPLPVFTCFLCRKIW